MLGIQGAILPSRQNSHLRFCATVFLCAQEIVPEGEWDAFMESLRAPLPTTFRINGRGKFAADLRDRLEQDFFSQFKEPIEVRRCQEHFCNMASEDSVTSMPWRCAPGSTPGVDGCAGAPAAAVQRAPGSEARLQWCSTHL